MTPLSLIPALTTYADTFKGYPYRIYRLRSAGSPFLFTMEDPTLSRFCCIWFTRTRPEHLETLADNVDEAITNIRSSDPNFPYTLDPSTLRKIELAFFHSRLYQLANIQRDRRIFELSNEINYLLPLFDEFTEEFIRETLPEKDRWMQQFPVCSLQMALHSLATFPKETHGAHITNIRKLLFTKQDEKSSQSTITPQPTMAPQPTMTPQQELFEQKMKHLDGLYELIIENYKETKHNWRGLGANFETLDEALKNIQTCSSTDLMNHQFDIIETRLENLSQSLQLPGVVPT